MIIEKFLGLLNCKSESNTIKNINEHIIPEDISARKIRKVKITEITSLGMADVILALLWMPGGGDLRCGVKNPFYGRFMAAGKAN